MITIIVELKKKKAVMKKLHLSLKLISQNQSVTRRLIIQNWSFTDSSSEEEDLHDDFNFDELIELTINWFSVFKIEFQRNK